MLPVRPGPRSIRHRGYCSGLLALPDTARRHIYIPRRFHICMEPLQPLESAGARQNPYRKRRRAKHYERFGEVIRYLTLDELQQLFDSMDSYTHKLMFEVIYELGCRVGEFVKMQVRHVSFSRSTVFFPAANTKTKTARTSSLPQGLTNELKSMLRQAGRPDYETRRLRISPRTTLEYPL